MMTLPNRSLFGALALLLTLQGCTFIGAGIGAGVDAATPGPYEAGEWDGVQIDRYDQIVVLTRNGLRAEGEYLGVVSPARGEQGAHILVNTDDGLARVRVSDVRSVAVEVPGRGWFYAGVVGLAVDAAVVVGASIAISNMEMDYSGALGDCFC